MSALGYTIIVLIYLVAIGYLGYLGYRKTTTAQDYMVAGRKIHPFIMALHLSVLRQSWGLAELPVFLEWDFCG